MKTIEYYADVTVSHKLEEWLLLQGATVLPGESLGGALTVFFGGRQIYFYSDRQRMRIFFNEQNESSRTLLLMMFPDAVIDHNFKDMA